MTSRNWRRVNHEKPCPICGKWTWCLIASDGTAVICPRTESTKRVGEAGFLHRLSDDSMTFRPTKRVYRASEPQPASRDFGPEVLDCIGNLDEVRKAELSALLGVSTDSLLALGCGWHSKFFAFSFPMVDSTNRAIGIRLRRRDGKKLSVPGSKEGLFIPNVTHGVDESLLIAEGASDVCALLDLGYRHVIGRPSCTGGVKLICELCRRREVHDVVVIADADKPGQLGAGNLASTLRVFVETVRVILPPRGSKDPRAFLQAGGSMAEIESAIASAPIQRGIIRGTQ